VKLPKPGKAGTKKRAACDKLEEKKGKIYLAQRNQGLYTHLGGELFLGSIPHSIVSLIGGVNQ